MNRPPAEAYWILQVLYPFTCNPDMLDWFPDEQHKRPGLRSSCGEHPKKLSRPCCLLLKYWSRTFIVSSARLRRGAEVRYIDTLKLDTLPHWILI